MQAITMNVKLSDGQFFEDVNGEYDVLASFTEYDKQANGFMWGMQTKAIGQRKYHSQSSVSRSIYAMLDSVKFHLKQGAQVRCITPDVVINFYNE